MGFQSYLQPCLMEEERKGEKKESLLTNIKNR